MKIQDTRAVITGGVSGLGLAVARHLVAGGGKVALLDINDAKGADAVAELGVVLTIDDFGEGYSALNYLRRLPIHGLKLAQPFLRGVPGNESDAAICQAVAGIAHALGLDLVAEGVESSVQRDFLMGLGVRTGQGFLFSPALDPDAFAAYLRQTG